ncbi:DUF4397 domain-containing protein [Angustibacter aerolatus]
MTRPPAVRLLLALALLLLVPADPAHAAGDGVAWVRAAHLVPDVGAARVDLAPLDGTPGTKILMTPGAGYGDVTDYQKVAPGSYTLTVRPSAGSIAPLLSRQFTVRKGRAVTLAIVGTASAPRLATLVDDLTPPARGAANVRVLPAVSLADHVSVQAVGGPALVQGAAIGQVTGYRSVPAGRWTLRVRGDDDPATTGSVRLGAGGVYTVVVLDGSAGRLRTKVFTDASGVGAAPAGGAQTGGGGTAGQAPGSIEVRAWTTAAGFAALLLLALGLARRVVGRSRRRE